MKSDKAKNKSKAVVREQILESMIASFKIEGIIINHEVALNILKKIQLSLEKSNG
jgi:hypothetical protein